MNKLSPFFLNFQLVAASGYYLRKEMLKIQDTIFWVLTLGGDVVQYQCFIGPLKHWYPTTSPHGIKTQKTTA